MSAAAAPRLAYVDAAGLARLRSEAPDHLLGVVQHGTLDPHDDPPAVPFSVSGLLARDGRPRYEVWRSVEPVRVDSLEGTLCACNDDVLFATIAFGDGEDFERAALEHYLRLFALIDRAGFPYLLRVWHYLPRIHRDDQGMERYKRFSVSRHEAFVRSGRDIARDAPAASAVGRQPGATVIALLAGKEPAQPIENPRQVSAYRYPGQYGPRGPTFARASRRTWTDSQQCFVSGTASIVGHESRHAGDPVAQGEETIRNLQALLGERAGDAFDELLFKVYVRPGTPDATVVRQLRTAFGERCDVLLLEAEICRRELLLEIEALALRANGSGA